MSGYNGSCYGVWATCSPLASAGSAQAWSKHDGLVIVTLDQEAARRLAESFRNNTRSPHVQYFPMEMEPNLAEQILAEMEALIAEGQAPERRQAGPVM